MDAQDYKTFGSLIPLLFDNIFSSCWEHFHACDCFYVAPFSCMKADTTNNIWGGWRTSDVKIASVLILLSKYRHIFFLNTRTTEGEWYRCLLLLLHNIYCFCNIYLGLLGGGRFLYASCIGILPIGLFIFHDAEERTYMCVCFYIYRYMKRERERHVHTCTQNEVFFKSTWI